MTLFPNKPLFSNKDRGLKRPRLVGRAGRLIFGLASLYFVREALTYWDFFVNSREVVFQSGYLFGVGIAFWLLPDVVNIGFNRKWGRSSQKLVLGAAILAIGLDFVFYGSWWGPPLGWVLWLSAVFTHLYLGGSHVLAALIATPGCEMRAIPHFLALLRREGVEGVVCPGHWTAVDNWENSLAGI